MVAARRLYFEAVRLGEDLPTLTKAPIDRVQLARYAGATGDFHPTHVDEIAARDLGFPSVVVPNSLAVGFVGQLVSDWSRGAPLKRISCRFIRTVWPGDTLSCRGRVVDRWGEAGKYWVDVEVWAENQRGELVIKGLVTLRLHYSPDDEHRARMGEPPVVVNVARQSLIATPPPPPSKVKSKVTSKPAAKAKPAAKKAPPKSKPKPKPAAKKAPKAKKRR